VALTGKLDADFSAFYDACNNAVRALGSLTDASAGAQAGLGGVDASISSIALGMAGATGAMELLQKGFEFLEGSVTAFADAESNVQHLTTALELSGNATTEVIQQYKDLGEQYQQTTIYSENMITSAEKTFTLIGNVAPDQMDNALKAATNLASGLGIDLTTAVTALSKAAEGNVTALKRYGVQIDAAAAKAGGASVVFDLVNQKFAGQAQADMDTTAGKIAQLANAWELFKEQTGSVVVDLGSIVGAMGNTTEAASNVIPKIDGATYALQRQAEQLPQTTTSWEDFFKKLAQIISYEADPVKFANDWSSGILQVKAAMASLSSGNAPTAPAFQMPKITFPTADAKDFATALALATEKYHELTPDVISNLDAAFKLGNVSIKELTANTGQSADVIEVARKAWEAHNTELKNAETAAKKFTDAQAAITAAYVPLTEQQKEAAVSNQNVGLSAEQTAKSFGISGAAVAAYLNGLKNAQAIEDAYEAQRQKMADQTSKLVAKSTDDFNKAQQQQADASAKTLVTDLDAYQTYTDKIDALSESSTQKQIDNIDQAEKKAISSLGIKTAATADAYDKAAAVIDTYYNHERDVANQTASTIEERMAAQGVYTDEQLAEQADAASVAYWQMAADGNYSAAQMEAAAKRANDAWDKSMGIVRTSWDTMAKTIETSLTELGQAIGGTFGKLATDASNAFKSATKGVGDLTAGFAAFSSGDILGGISGIVSGVTSIASAAISAGKSVVGLVENLFGLGSKGRDAVVAFANSMGGFDELHTKLDALGDSGEQLWIKLTQGVGKNDPAAAQAAITAVTNALNAQTSASATTTVQTEQQAVATIQTATEATNALVSVSDQLKSNATDWQTWGDAVNGVINAVGAAVIAMPMPSAPGGVPGFAGGTGGQYLNFGSGTLAMLHGNERVMTQGEGAGGGGGGTAIIQINSTTVAEIVVPDMPGVIRRYGLA
jgi:predicted transcriptional regulator